MKILTRIKKGTNRVYEYFLNHTTSKGECVFHDWMTAQEICNLPECTVQPAAVRQKISEFNKGKIYFKNHYDLVCHNRENSVINKHTKKNQATSIEWVTFVSFLNSWPIGSLHKKAKRIQTKCYN